MSRLITFGCSTTQGEGLENPQKETWGAYLSNLLDTNHINEGIAGASNKLISYKVTTFEYQSDDTVIILWANPNRYSIINSDYEYYNIFPSSNTLESMLYYKHFHQDFDHMFINKVFTNHAIHYLKKCNVNFYQLFYNKELIQYVDDSSNTLPIELSYYFKKYPLALDDLHLGKEGNLAYATQIHKRITQSNII